MKRILIAILLLPFAVYSQPNCNAYEGDCKAACKLGIKAEGGQGSRTSQEKFDNAIKLCPDKIAYFYMEKAVPYLKRGDFITWKKLIDKAVEIDPIGQLGYRGWCRFQFLRDYRGAIKDIELLDSISITDIGYAQNGQHHLYTILALCYKKVGEIDKAISILENHIGVPNYDPWAYEFLHLGVMKLEIGDYELSKFYLEKQMTISGSVAETLYYLGLATKQLGEEKWQDYFVESEKLYREGKKLFDVYSTPVDKIYLSEIQNELDNID